MINRKLNGFFAYVLLVAVLCVGCNDWRETTAEFSSVNTFVVFNIDYYNENCSKYQTIYFNGTHTSNSTIIAKKGLFNIGDTVCVGKHCY